MSGIVDETDLVDIVVTSSLTRASSDIFMSCNAMCCIEIVSGGIVDSGLACNVCPRSIAGIWFVPTGNKQGLVQIARV